MQQQNDQDILALQEAIARLEAEKQVLERIKDIKLRMLSASLQNVPANFEARHPVIGFLGRQGYHAARSLGRAAAGGARAYINFLREEQEREAMLRHRYPRAFKNKA